MDALRTRTGMSRPRKVHVKSFGCQMNVYDSHRMADTLAPAGFTETAQSRGRRSRHPQHLPHPRKGGGEGLFRDRPHPRDERGRRARRPPHADRGRRLRRAGGRQRNHPPRGRGRSGRRLAELSPAAGHDRARASAARKSSIPNFRSRTSSTFWPRPNETRSPSAAFPLSSPCRKAATSSARSASCPTRAARKSRARLKRSSPKSSGWPMPACAK